MNKRNELGEKRKNNVNYDYMYIQYGYKEK